MQHDRGTSVYEPGARMTMAGPCKWPAVALLVAASFVLAASMAQAGVVEPGHSAAWYDPARDGEGWILEIHADDRALVTWYTYDEAGGQRWLMGEGDVVRDGDDGDSIVFPELYVTRGGRFGADFDPSQVERDVVGSATLVFDDCDRGRIRYQAFDQDGELDLYRLTRTMAAGCRPIHGMTGEPVFDYAGHSGAWYQPARDGEGWLLQWMAHNEALVTWYTYDSEGNQFWLIGEGALVDGRLVFPELYSTRGGRFGEPFNPDDVERISWGRLELSLDCDAGSAWYESDRPGFRAAEIDGLAHLSHLAQPACPWQPPAFTDLYDLGVTRLATERTGPREPSVLVRDLADDGTVIATASGLGVQRLGPNDGGEWVLVPGAGFDQIRTDVQLSPDARTMTASRAYDDDDLPSSVPLRWLDETGQWEMLPGLSDVYRATPFSGVSPNHKRVVGRALPEEGGTFPWLWDAENGQILLPLSDGLDIGVYPTSASDDGRVVFGTTLHFPYGPGFARQGAVRWVDGQPPEPLFDDLGYHLGLAGMTDASGRVVFGFDQVQPDDDHPNLRQAWYWIGPGQMAYLGTFDDEFLGNSRPFWIADVTHDGSMAVGGYSNGPGFDEAVIWTQDTGLVSLRDVLQETGLLGELEGDTGPWRYRSAVKVSSSGDMILIQGFSDRPNYLNYHGAILHLTPKR